ncbi:MAG: SDR family oxidoreductase [Candidatus Lokiarchaeota archaeon]|nr:SDR family oxidoreductase [Candidatus Lokiarchaeota archaeon]
MINETAIVTGSTSGIGKKIAELFLKEGCKVAICSRNEINVNQTVAEFKKEFGESVIGIPCDVSDPAGVKNLIDKTVEAFGSIRILVANAGVNITYGPFQYLTLDQVNSNANTIIGINLIGALNSISAVLPQMIEQKYGRIITLSGGGADRPMENMTIYSASKGGVVAFSQCLAKELDEGENDIKINIFQPGMILTNLYNVSLIEAWKDKETYESEMDLLKKYVMTDVEKSSMTVIPYALPTCKENGKSFRGFPLTKMIRGFMKVSKERKRMNST